MKLLLLHLVGYYVIVSMVHGHTNIKYEQCTMGGMTHHQECVTCQSEDKYLSDRLGDVHCHGLISHWVM